MLFTVYNFKEIKNFRKNNSKTKHYYDGGISPYFRQYKKEIYIWLQSNYNCKVYNNVLTDYLAIFTHLETTGTLNNYKK